MPAIVIISSANGSVSLSQSLKRSLKILADSTDFVQMIMLFAGKSGSTVLLVWLASAL